MESKHIKIGFIGEKAVLNHMVRKGYSHIESNFRAKTGEIDVICRKGNISYTHICNLWFQELVLSQLKRLAILLSVEGRCITSNEEK